MSTHVRITSGLVALLIAAPFGFPEAGSVLGAYAQPETSHAITGQVVGAERRAPLPGANVFIDGTTWKTATDSTGRFRLDGLPSGRYTLVASRNGYRLQERPLEMPAMGDWPLRIELAPRATEREGLPVNDRQNEWRGHLDRFKELYLGTGLLTEDLELLNPEVLRFSENDSTFQAAADRPLRVVNGALGYRMDLYIRRFEVLERKESQRLQKRVFKQFHERTPESEAQAERWKENRRRAYLGSIQHFVRALRDGTLEEEGFRLYKSNSMSVALIRSNRPSDAVERTQNANRRVSPSEVLAESGERKIILRIEDARYLRVDYREEPMPRAFIRQEFSELEKMIQAYKELDMQVSWLDVRGREVILDVGRGQFFEPFAPTLQGYWRWAEQGLQLLPQNYEPLQ